MVLSSGSVSSSCGRRRSGAEDRLVLACVIGPCGHGRVEELCRHKGLRSSQ